MLAHGEEINVFDDDHLIVFLIKQRIEKHLLGVLCVSSCQHLHGFCHAHGGLLQAFALWVFAEK